MKLIKRLGPIIAIGVFVVGLAVLGIARFQMSEEQNQTDEQLTRVRSELNEIQLEELSSRQAELKEQISKSTSQFNEANAIISQPAGSINVSSTFFDVAKTFGLKVIELTTTSPSIESLEGINYSMVSLTATVRGKTADIIDFVTGMNFSLKTGTIKSAIITIPEAGSGDNVSATIQLVAYNNKDKQ